mgnify:CR=1 FL=1
MLLMSETLKDKIDPDVVFEDDTQPDIYTSSTTAADFLCTVNFESGNTLTGKIISIEKDEAEYDSSGFRRIEICFLCSRIDMATFISEDIISKTDISFQDLNIFAYDRDKLRCKVLKKIKILEDNTSLCELTLMEINK